MNKTIIIEQNSIYIPELNRFILHKIIIFIEFINLVYNNLL